MKEQGSSPPWAYSPLSEGPNHKAGERSLRSDGDHVAPRLPPTLPGQLPDRPWSADGL